MKIETNKNGKLYIDGNEKDIKDLTIEFLEDVVDKALIGEIDFALENDSLPMTQFFQQIQIGTSENSVLKSKLNEIEKSNKDPNLDDLLTQVTYSKE